MPGGDRQPYEESVKPIFEAIAAKSTGPRAAPMSDPMGLGTS